MITAIVAIAVLCMAVAGTLVWAAFADRARAREIEEEERKRRNF